MSIIRCADCQEQRDSDFIGFFVRDSKEICEYCEEKYEIEEEEIEKKPTITEALIFFDNLK